MIFAATEWDWVTNQGLAVGILIVMGLAGWRVFVWTGANVVIPMKDSAISYLEENAKTMKSNAEATSTLTSTMSNLHSDVKEIKTKLDTSCMYRISGDRK